MSPTEVAPRVIIHGGAGNILRENLPPAAYKAYRHSLLEYLKSTSELLASGATALDAAVHAVTRLEDDPLFNCGRGAVFSRAGTIELEASVMVSRGYRKRGCGVTLVKNVKNPIKLAREVLVRGETDGGRAVRIAEDSGGERGGAQGHVFIGGETATGLAREWGLDIVDEKYHWTRRRWEEHKRGLQREAANDTLGVEPEDSNAFDELDGLPEWADIADEYWGPNAHWDGKEYLPQGTVGTVCLDKYGTVAVATSTGGLTNKLPGRIGDTPTFGAGFWAEEWTTTPSPSSALAAAPAPAPVPAIPRVSPPIMALVPTTLRPTLASCIPASWAQHLGIMARDGTITPPEPASAAPAEKPRAPAPTVHAVAMSGTGNGDSFLRLAATRTAGSIVRFSSHPARSLQSALTQIVGPGGEMQQSAGERWGHTGEGEGGTIGIEVVGGVGRVAADLNCGGMFRAWVDDEGRHRMMVFREEY